MTRHAVDDGGGAIGRRAVGLVRLGWRLARAGGRLRTVAAVSGNAIGAALLLLAAAIPAAVQDPGAPADDETALLARSAVVFLCLPITMLLLSIGRLSAGTRDRRLGALRMLGLSPTRTRLVAGVENGLLAAPGTALGLVAYLVMAPLVSGWVAVGPGWFQQPLRLTPAAIAATCGGVVLLSVAVSLAPTRALQQGHMQVRHEGAAPRPSRWRLVPLALGVATLVAALLLPSPAQTSRISEDQFAMIVLGGTVLAGLGLAIALPLAVRAAADLLAGRSRGVVLRLAANRLACEPASNVRVVAGIAVVAFLATGSVGVVAAFARTPEYVSAAHAYEQGPQTHRLARQYLVGEPEAPALTHRQLERIATTAGVQAVIPQYHLTAAGCESSDPDDFCGPVFVGTCAQLNLLWVVPDCRDAEVSPIRDESCGGCTGHAEDRITLRSSRTGARVAVPVGGPVLDADRAATEQRFPDYDPVALFVPAGSPEVAAILGEPDSYIVLSDPGQPSRDAVQAAVAELPLHLELDYLDPYWNVQRLQAFLWTMTAVVLGIGLFSTLLTALDRAIERRRHVASHLALGVRLRVLRGSQLLQILIPLWIAMLAAVALGFLPLLGMLRLVNTAQAPPVATVAVMAVAAAMAAGVVAAATLPGIGGRLTPDLLRRE